MHETERRWGKLELMDMNAEWFDRRSETHRLHIPLSHSESSCPYG